jgi:hypothetical protein
LMAVYRHHGAWTYPSAHRWPVHEVMYTQPLRSSAERRHPFTSEWLLDVTRLRSWSPPWRDPRRHLEPLDKRCGQALPP